ncbi:glycosyltransferase family 4 protein [Plasticicumulans acidivorans]|uniref:Glycosyltransferase involved in cell wall biosynthesis n=1 Tax=Plasticicumulans acidivorans TaxID=886464 RepID=A0A317MRL0_9GAMM|nr:glycosyltransferase family 4 protein [Plasticicumulans acidivorans]PWV58928.1 glycosyltransferase involved in cell wall biosynthesis [Plasticicumulans acidivorans]
MRILTFSTLYPNPTAPHFGVFVENRLRQLLSSGEVQARVVAPVPWVPGDWAVLGGYARMARVPLQEIRHGIDVLHPAYPQLPKVGMNLHPYGLAWAILPVLRRLIASGFDFDLIDAHYFYPDGVAAHFLARKLGKPFVVTSRGSDLVTIARDYAFPRRLIQAAAQAADGLITVSKSLQDELVALGIARERSVVLRNGVDLEQFQPGERAAARAQFGVTGRVIASVGHLIPRKGNEFIIRALPQLPDVSLLIAGDGPQRQMLTELAAQLGVAERVHFAGVVGHAQLAQVYSAADILVLATGHEGWPNVLLEAMACGTPVIATAVSGCPEIVTAPVAGRLIPDREPATIAAAVSALFEALPERAATRAYAEGFGWEPTTQGQLALFRDILARRRQAA